MRLVDWLVCMHVANPSAKFSVVPSGFRDQTCARKFATPIFDDPCQMQFADDFSLRPMTYQ